jgi:hypothetical protein
MYGRSLAWVTVGFVLSACAGGEDPISVSGSTTSGSGASGGGGGGGGVGGADGGGGVGGTPLSPCAEHDNEPMPVEEIAFAEDLPAGTGGPIVEGEYHLVEMRRYTGPGGMTGPTGRMMQESQLWNVVEMKTVVDLFQGDGEQRFHFGYDLGDGTGDVSFITICPTAVSVPYERYTAAPTTLTLYAPMFGLASIYEIQPHE